MTIEITKAIKARWDARSLGSSVTGGIHNGREPERSTMPYCIFNEVGANSQGETKCFRMGRYEAQFDIYTNDGNPETCADLAVLVRDALVHSNNAVSSPLNATGIGITNVLLGRDITTRAEGEEQVYRSMFTIVIKYTESANRTPA